MKNFKDSGIEWLGEIPEHWEVVKINKIVTFVNGYAFENFDLNPTFEIPVIRIGDIQKEKILYDNCLKTKEKEKLKQFLISNNDILIALSGATTGKIAFCDTDNKAYINQRVAIVRSKLKLVKYYFLTRGFSLLIELACNGSAQPNISTKEIGEFKIPLPPLKEQEQIANFLDEKCEKIKNFIEKKEKLISLLKEQKQALINETITKGLDKNVNFKDSGIEWLGEIPQHWEVVRLGLILKTGSGTTPDSGNDKYYKEGKIAWINSGDLNDGFLKDSKRKITQDALYDYPTLRIFDKNSLIIAMYGATIGKTAILKINACVNQACCVLEKSLWYNNFYLFFWFNGYKKELISMGSGGGQPNISQDIIKNLKIPLPPLKEQEQIANFLDEKCEKIDLLIEKTEKQIKLIKEYKTTLINQAVCGRIDL
ncbi:type I restriction/modification system, subunit S [Campylobacter lari]|uniref:type I restriction/modification system, subunit S n=1 Tax=Campylobacter lari TaxID=201 RepID=UPI00057F12DF|nr:type I restriction/modification system, subunit S [Campylobacter lari]AJC89902.1 type I restriction/modification system, S subunit [Campylobacter lari subsp. concheus LMG 11760]EAK0950650.1 type I restriction/modification system, subunit S [Campylobacter lari]EAL3897417.1 type I restriction/modification system, subunit S [Campylobacter lari]EGK8087084.1 type I restriction/modification system, subunit S [Campylobacter lari]EGQ5682242.1 type I restriction/modification system, subunit S [Campy